MPNDPTPDKAYRVEPGEQILATYNLCLIGPRARWDHGDAIPLGFAASVHEAEENINDLMPPGFRVVIREWDETEETP